MAIEATCPGCGKESEVPEAYQGKRVRCQDCSTPFQVPHAIKPAAAAAPLKPIPISANAKKPAALKPVPVSDSTTKPKAPLKPIPITSQKPAATDDAGLDFADVEPIDEPPRRGREPTEPVVRTAVRGRGNGNNAAVWIGAGATVIVALLVVIIVLATGGDDDDDESSGKKAGRKKEKDAQAKLKKDDAFVPLPEKKEAQQGNSGGAAQNTDADDQKDTDTKAVGIPNVDDPNKPTLPANPDVGGGKKPIVTPRPSGTKIEDLEKRRGLVVLNIGGKPTPVRVEIDRRKLTGNVTVSMIALPKGVLMRPVEIPAGERFGTLELIATDKAEGQIAVATLVRKTPALIQKQNVELSVRISVKRGE